MRNVCGEHVIVGEGLGAVNFGKLISLNETAAYLWEEAARQGDFGIDSLVKALTDEYDVDEERARGDVEHIVGEWQKIGVVE